MALSGESAAAPAEGPSTLAADLLAACRRGESTAGERAGLATLDDAALAPVREDRRTALAFWLNCYNAGTQLLLSERPALYESPLRFFRFFRAPAITVAGTALGLDRIEHGLLRGGRSKYGLGYLPRVLVTTFEQRHRLPDCDPRIHFALNCGAVSCPAVRAYEPEHVDDQLDVATERYLDGTVDYDPAEGVVSLPRLFLWYRGDFGGRSGIHSFLRRYGAIPADATPSLRYRSWDWSRAAGNFAD